MACTHARWSMLTVREDEQCIENANSDPCLCCSRWTAPTILTCSSACWPGVTRQVQASPVSRSLEGSISTNAIIIWQGKVTCRPSESVVQGVLKQFLVDGRSHLRVSCYWPDSPRNRFISYYSMMRACHISLSAYLNILSSTQASVIKVPPVSPCYPRDLPPVPRAHGRIPSSYD